MLLGVTALLCSVAGVAVAAGAAWLAASSCVTIVWICNLNDSSPENRIRTIQTIQNAGTRLSFLENISSDLLVVAMLMGRSNYC